jgi:N6-adenosine-specific RNA methylase IME4
MMPKKYGVIIADPPWDYEQSHIEGAAAREYSTMSLEELSILPIPKLAAENSILLLWATWPKLNEACLPLMKEWGFDYVTGFPWVKITSIAPTLWGKMEIKVPYGVGFWARGCTEMVLIGRRGKVSPPQNGFVGILSPNLYHSRKPEHLYEYAEALPGPYLELFARRKREGWDTWGNEVDGIDISQY